MLLFWSTITIEGKPPTYAREKNQPISGRRFLVSPIKIRDLFPSFLALGYFQEDWQNKTAIMYFYFHSFFCKNGVGGPIKQIIIKCWPIWPEIL